MRYTSLTFLLILNLFGTNQASEPVSEASLKALFVEKFALYTTWPDPIGDTSPVTIALLGESPVTEQISNLYNETFMGKPCKIISLVQDDSIPHCHILYIAVEDTSIIQEIINNHKTFPILTITDIPWAADLGVHITMYLKNRKIRFEINRETLEESPVAISYKLLQLSEDQE